MMNAYFFCRDDEESSLQYSFENRQSGLGIMFPHPTSAFVHFHSEVSKIPPSEKVVIGICNGLILQVLVLTLGSNNGATYALVYALTHTGQHALQDDQFVYFDGPLLDLAKIDLMEKRNAHAEAQAYAAVEAELQKIIKYMS